MAGRGHSSGGGRFTYEPMGLGWAVAWRASGAVLGYVERKRGQWQPYGVRDGRHLTPVGMPVTSRGEAAEVLLDVWRGGGLT